jgi:hypothetical protein
MVVHDAWVEVSPMGGVVSASVGSDSGSGIAEVRSSAVALIRVSNRIPKRASAPRPQEVASGTPDRRETRAVNAPVPVARERPKDRQVESRWDSLLWISVMSGMSL